MLIAQAIQMRVCVVLVYWFCIDDETYTEGMSTRDLPAKRTAALLVSCGFFLVRSRSELEMGGAL